MAVKDENGHTRFDRYRLKDVDKYRENKREWAKTPDQRRKRTEYMQKWREKNRERHNELARQSHQRNKYKHIGKARKYNLLRNYGITEQDYERMLIDQDGVCKICGYPPHGHGKNPESKKLHVDHDHKTGEVRGLLCSRCNGALGWYEKQKENIESYLVTAITPKRVAIPPKT